MRTLFIILFLFGFSISSNCQDSSIYKFNISNTDTIITTLKKSASDSFILSIYFADSTIKATESLTLLKWTKEIFEKEIGRSLWNWSIKRDSIIVGGIKNAFEYHTNFINKNELEEIKKKNEDLLIQLKNYKDLLRKSNSDSFNFAKVYLLANQTFHIKITSLEDMPGIIRVNICDSVEANSNCDSIYFPENISSNDFAVRLLKPISNIGGPQADSLKPETRSFFATSIYNDWKEKIEKNTQRILINNSFKSIANTIDSLTRRKDTATVEIRMFGRLPIYKLKEGIAVGKRKVLINSYNKEVTDKFLIIQKALFRIEHGFITSISFEPKDTVIDGLHINKTLIYNYYIDIRSAIESKALMDHFFPLKTTHKKIMFYDDDPNRAITKRKKENTKHPNPYANLLYINLSDFLKYYINIDNVSDVLVHVRNRNVSFSEDTTKSGATSKSVSLREKDFSSFAQLNVYTDLIGLSENKPNGILQIEGKFETDIFRTPINWNKQYTRARWFILSNAQVNISITKLEDKLKFLDIKKSDLIRRSGDTLRNSRYINNIDLIQYSSLNIGITAKVAEIVSDYFRSNIFFGAAIMRTPMRDTAYIQAQNGSSFLKEDEIVSNTIRLNYGISFQLKSTSSLGLETGVQFIHLKFNNTDIKNGFEEYDNAKDTVVVRQASFWKNAIVNPFLNIYYHLDQEESKRLFIRASYFRDLETRKNDFTYFQFGYSTDMKGLFRLFSKNEKKDLQMPE